VFKNGDKPKSSNYRPISLLTAFSKVFEKVIYARLYQHLNKNNILIKDQYRFRSTSSTDTASYRLINEILSTLNKKLTVGAIFCDLDKAF
jgi:hypothetical protein